MPDPLPHRAILSVAVTLLLSIPLQGCATLHPASYSSPVPEDVRRGARTVSVVSTVAATDNSVPRLDVRIGKRKGAATGAAAGAGTGFLSGVMVSAAGGPLAPVLAPIVIPTFVLAGMAGGTVMGWSVAVPAEDAEAANAALSRSRSDLSAEVARRIVSRLPSVGKAAASPVAEGTPDLRIEVSVDRWGLAGGAGSDPMTGFFVETSYRVARGSDNATLDRRSFIEGGPQRTVSRWTCDNAALLSKAVDETLSRVAETVSDGTFLVEDFRVEGKYERRALCGLKPISPSSMFHFGTYESGPPRVDSLTPRFEWESFPRREDVEEDAAKILSRVSEVRYDLRIWKSEGGGPGEVVYERTGLALPAENGAVRHTVETPLSAGSGYLWSVRARFRLDGEERVTRWSYDNEINVGAIPLSTFRKSNISGAMDPYRQTRTFRRPCVDDSIPPLHYFSFRTP